MSQLSTHLGTDQEPIARVPAIFYRKPANLYTKKDAALMNSRIVGDKDAQLHFVIEHPTHYCRSGSPLSPDEIFELRLALRSERTLTDGE